MKTNWLIRGFFVFVRTQYVYEALHWKQAREIEGASERADFFSLSLSRVPTLAVLRARRSDGRSDFDRRKKKLEVQ